MTMLNMNLRSFRSHFFPHCKLIEIASKKLTIFFFGIPERSLEAVIGIVWDYCLQSWEICLSPRDDKYSFKVVIFARFFKNNYICYVENLGSIRTHLFAHHFFCRCVAITHTHTHPNSSDLQGCLRFQICRCIFFVPPPLQNRNQVQSHLEFGLVSLVLLSNPPSTWVGSSQDGA